MVNLTVDALSKLKKLNLINLILKLYSEIKKQNEDLLKEVWRINESFRRLDSDFAIPKKANTSLPENILSNVLFTFLSNVGLMVNAISGKLRGHGNPH